MEQQKINVTLGNNEVLEGTIVGSCAIHDIAVVKINGRMKEIFKPPNLETLINSVWDKGSMLSVTRSV